MMNSVGRLIGTMTETLMSKQVTGVCQKEQAGS